MSVLFIDAFSGISGDMTVGAMCALGLPLAQLQEQLSLLPLDGYEIAATSRFVNGIAATKFDVHVHDHHHGHDHAHRKYRDIREMISVSALVPAIRDTALAIFAALAKAEARVHGVEPENVTFHEVGAVDSIIDIVGAAIAVHYFAIDRMHVSPLPLGSGVVQSQHGPIPVPGPATAELLKRFPTRLGDGEGELVTPTGAAIVAALASPGPVPALTIEAIGYGAGQRTLSDRPNLLRLVLGSYATQTQSDELLVLECNIDDLNPEIYEHVMERVLEAGARDVYLTPVHMKKNRPGIILSVLCAESQRDQLAAIILNETSSIGVRFYPVQRLVLERDIVEVATTYGVVRVKVAKTPDGNRNVAPEYEDCKKLARENQVPLKLVYQEAVTAALFAP